MYEVPVRLALLRSVRAAGQPILERYVLMPSAKTRMGFLPATCFVLAALAGRGWAAGADEPLRPNFVFILVDDLRWDELGCAGHPFVKTPHIDRIANEGAAFRNAFVTTPFCSPSRASFLTGLYAHKHGIIDNTDRSAASHGLKTFPQLLRRGGYETGYAGKWHMGNDPSARPGFDYWVSIPGQGECIDPELYEDGRRHRVCGYITDVLTQRAVAFLERPRTGPFFLYLAHKAIHPNLQQRDDGSVVDLGGFIPAPRHTDLYAGCPVPRRPSAGRAPQDKPALMRPIEGLPPLGRETMTPDHEILGRLRMLAAVDEGVGEIFRALESTGQLDRTVLVFASDNGYFNGEHGLSVERRLAYEESIRIPLLVRYPPLVKPGTSIEPFALGIDLAPTLLDLAGVASEPPLHGRSLVPLLCGEQVPWRKSFLIEYFTDRVFPRVRNMGYQAVRTGRYKYIRYTELPGMEELYDLQADPYELRNLARDSVSGETLQSMQGELDRLLEGSR